jgi:branched-chain amino acid transport system permease protein
MTDQLWFVGQQITNGLVLGSVYTLLAMGFSLTFGVLGLVNASHGHLYMIGAFTTFQVISWWFGPQPGVMAYIAALITSVFLVSVVGGVIYLLGIKPIWGKGEVAPIITTLAFAFLLENIAIVLWPGTFTIQTELSSRVRTLGGVFLTDQRVLTFVAALVLVSALSLFLHRSRTGKAMRATSQNELSASLMGINTEAMRILALMLASALAAAAGGLVGPLFVLTPSMAQPALFKAFAVVLVGGLGNVPGSIIGGLFLGLTEALVGGLWDPAWVSPTIFGVIIVILLFQPAGLLGSKRMA